MLTLGVSMHAQLLWKISGKDTKQPSYIVGTHHMAPVSFVDSIAGLRQAMADTRQLYGEINMSKVRTPEFAQRMAKAMMLPQGTTLKSLFRPAQYDSINVTVKKLFGMDLSFFNQLKPAAVTTQITAMLAAQANKDFNPNDGLDEYFQKTAAKAGKKVDGLETADLQFKVLFDSQSLQRQAELLYCIATQMDREVEQTRKLTQAYLSQDLTTMAEIIDEKTNTSCDSRPEELEALIYNRNANWCKSMPAIMQQAPTLFVVGAGHLPGERGLIKLLQTQGYTVEAVK